MADIAGATGETFDVAVDGAVVPLTLTAVRPFGTAPAGAQREPFDLIFRSEPQVMLPQGTYPFRHKSVGVIDIFIVPTAAGADGVTYQAVFS